MSEADWNAKREDEIAGQLVSSIEMERQLRAQHLATLVNFTDFAALENIVNAKEIWFSPVSAMNDFEEVTAGKNLIMRGADVGGGLMPAFEPIIKN